MLNRDTPIGFEDSQNALPPEVKAEHDEYELERFSDFGGGFNGVTRDELIGLGICGVLLFCFFKWYV